jgi:CheY-specific phosphatase CheX
VIKMVLHPVCTDELMKTILKVAYEKDEDVYNQKTDKEALGYVAGAMGILKSLSIYLFDTDTAKEMVKRLNDQEKHLKSIAIRRPASYSI